MVGKPKLKVLNLERLEPGMHSDGAGLYLDVQEYGSRSWILRVTIARTGKRQTIGLGGLSYVSPAEAREKAAEFRAKARKGEDVIAQRRHEKELAQHEASIPTFRA